MEEEFKFSSKKITLVIFILGVLLSALVYFQDTVFPQTKEGIEVSPISNKNVYVRTIPESEIDYKKRFSVYGSGAEFPLVYWSGREIFVGAVVSPDIQKINIYLNDESGERKVIFEALSTKTHGDRYPTGHVGDEKFGMILVEKHFFLEDSMVQDEEYFIEVEGISEDGTVSTDISRRFHVIAPTPPSVSITVNQENLVLGERMEIFYTTNFPRNVGLDGELRFSLLSEKCLLEECYKQVPYFRRSQWPKKIEIETRIATDLPKTIVLDTSDIYEIGYIPEGKYYVLGELFYAPNSAKGFDPDTTSSTSTVASIWIGNDTSLGDVLSETDLTLQEEIGEYVLTAFGYKEQMSEYEGPFYNLFYDGEAVVQGTLWHSEYVGGQLCLSIDKQDWAKVPEPNPCLSFSSRKEEEKYGKRFPENTDVRIRIGDFRMLGVGVPKGASGQPIADFIEILE